jgi:hypothetical protein
MPAFSRGAAPGQIGIVTSPAGGVHPAAEAGAEACAHAPAAPNAIAATSSFLFMFKISRIDYVLERPNPGFNPRGDHRSRLGV